MGKQKEFNKLDKKTQVDGETDTQVDRLETEVQMQVRRGRHLKLMKN